MPSTKYIDMCCQAEKLQEKWKVDLGSKVWCQGKGDIFTVGQVGFCCGGYLHEGFKSDHKCIFQLAQLYDLAFEVCQLGWVTMDEECLGFFYHIMKVMSKKSISGKVTPNMTKEEAMLTVIMLRGFNEIWNPGEKRWMSANSKPIIQVVS